MSYQSVDSIWAVLPNSLGLKYGTNGLLLANTIMAENYTKAQRNKRDFDRTMKILDRENKMALNLINTEKMAIGASLLVSTRECQYRSRCHRNS